MSNNNHISLYKDHACTEAMAEAMLFMIEKLQKEKPELLNRLKPIIENTNFIFDINRLSPVVINRHYKILLPGFGNREVKIHALSKAVYLLFLTYPEGIRFKELYLHKKELLSLYNKLTNRYDNKEIEQAIDDLVDVTNPSLNQKCARIRAAFRKIMGDYLAKYYYIDGPNGNPKKILLPVQLIDIRY